MYRRIIITTHDGNKFAGDIYKVDKTSPVIFGYPPHNTKQEFDEFEKLRLTHTITIHEMECWWSEEAGSSDEKKMRSGNMNRLAAYEEVLTIIADRHGLYVYFDFDIDINILRFRFYLNDREIYKGCLKLSEIISHNVFELLEKEVEKRIERLKGKLHDKKGD